MSDRHPDPPRWTGAAADPGSPEGRAGDRLGRLRDLAPPADATLTRIRHEVLTARRGRPRPPWTRRLVYAAVGGVLVAGSALGSWAIRSARQEVRGSLTVAGGGVGRLSVKHRYRIAAVGAADVAFGDEGDGSLELVRGTLVIETAEAAAKVRCGDVSIDVASASLSTIERGAGLPPSVAALSGAMQVRGAAGARAALVAGQVWRPDGVGAVEAGAAARARRLLDGEDQPPAAARASLAPAPGPAPDPTPRPAVAHRADEPRAPARSKLAATAPSAPRGGPANARAGLGSIAASPPAAESPPVAASSEPTSAEAAAFARALQRLRQDRDPGAALRLFDDYDRAYPRGRLGGEATLARIEAHLDLADAAGALRVLDGARIDTLPRAAEARVLRGELRSDAGRCGDAVADFSAVVAGAAAPAIRERALHGRALCLARLGQTAAARADARLYMSQFPHGRFAAEMHRAAEGEDPR